MKECSYGNLGMGEARLWSLARAWPDKATRRTIANYFSSAEEFGSFSYQPRQTYFKPN